MVPSAMVTVKTQCSVCGTVEVTPDLVFIYKDHGEPVGIYGLTCPVCLDVLEHAADAETLLTLQQVGAQSLEISAFTAADVDQFAEKLSHTDDLMQFFLPRHV